jgi:glyoxylase-like metal-dependent hydrolase (beta-lactamase superfamily II)
VYKFDVIRKGKESGVGTLFVLETSRGTKIFGLPTLNFYGGDWDLGPTWNYLIVSENLTLFDTGRRGEGKALMEMIAEVGYDPKELHRVIVSHGHEDHDGGLAEIIAGTGANLAAHGIYGRLISYYSGAYLPAGVKTHFPASCWHCIMPDSFSSLHCMEYHSERSSLELSIPIEDGSSLDGGALQFCHIPGHAPDSIAILIDGEVLLCGDTVLPEITPHPSREASYCLTRHVLPEQYSRENALYGLKAYIRSIKKLCKWIDDGVTTLPAHRLYYMGCWNWINLRERVIEIIDHHIERCRHILSLINEGSNTVDQIARGHFEPSMLKGAGMGMARNEIHSHLELLEATGDVKWADGEHLECGKTYQFEESIRLL